MLTICHQEDWLLKKTLLECRNFISLEAMFQDYSYLSNFHMLSLHESHIWPDLSELELYKLEITNLVLVTFPWIWRKASCWFWDKMIIGLHISYSTSSKTMSFWNQLSKNKLNSNFVEKYFFHHPSLSRNHRSKYLLYDIRPVHCD